MTTLTTEQKRFFARTKAAIQQAESPEAVAKIGKHLKERWARAKAKDPLGQDTADYRTLANYAKTRYYQLGGAPLNEQLPLKQPVELTDADMQAAEQKAEIAYEAYNDTQASNAEWQAEQYELSFE